MQRPPWLGRAIGAAIGWFLAGPIGLLLGLTVGYFVDQARAVQVAMAPGVDLARNTFFETTFSLMGRIAKSDGRVSEREVAVTEQLMVRMGLSAEHRQQAIALFKSGAAEDFAVDAQLDAFVRDCAPHINLRHMLLMFLFSTAAADGELAGAEHELLGRIATRIGFSAAAFEQLMRMFSAQDAFSRAPGQAPRTNDLAEAYAALGVQPGDDDRSVKQAYRRLMSQYHPDKLIAEGMPEDMVRMATERTQEIQNAWEMVRKARGIS